MDEKRQEDKLDELFRMQAALNKYIVAARKLPDMTAEENRDLWLSRQMVALISELGEVLGEINFKWWKNPKETDIAALKEELVDVGHFFLSMCITAGMTADEFYRIYLDKNAENFRRQDGTGKKSGYSTRMTNDE